MAIRFGGAHSTTVKMALIGLVILVLLVPLTMLEGMVRERAGMREQAFQKVASGWGGSLTIGGPVITVPTEHRVLEGAVTKVYREDLFMLPERVSIKAALKQEPEPRYVGIYNVPVYMVTLQLSGAFELQGARDDMEARYAGHTFHWQQARLRIPLSDARSLRQLGRARLDDRDLSFSPTGRGPYSGIDTAISLDATPRAFDIELKMAGSREVSFLPLGATTDVQLSADWPDPSFQGAFLPADRTVGAGGFRASWQVLQLNRSFGQHWLQSEVDVNELAQSSFGVGLYQAVDVYQRSERAMKYALLFIALTFMTFFAWEHMAKTRLHPLQYLLVGLALSIFYLLLIALSEHVPFAAAYWSAAVALVLLVGVYLAGAMRNRLHGSVAALVVAGVYAVLYTLVLSESYSLLIGAVILFTALGAVMLVTRHVDWYGAESTEEC
jgi:inner membrane protein